MATYRNNERAAAKRNLLQAGLNALRAALALNAGGAKRQKKDERPGWRKETPTPINLQPVILSPQAAAQWEAAAAKVA